MKCLACKEDKPVAEFAKKRLPGVVGLYHQNCRSCRDSTPQDGDNFQVIYGGGRSCEKSIAFVIAQLSGVG